MLTVAMPLLLSFIDISDMIIDYHC
uniref:Uncharacterized protein n=1 Tax=Arundo donax TaxID=35708 RepID=A0A0A8ZPA3_ARUDO